VRAPATIDGEGLADAETANPLAFIQTSPRNRIAILASPTTEWMHTTEPRDRMRWSSRAAGIGSLDREKCDGAERCLCIVAGRH
jgi:hypothetical protein